MITMTQALASSIDDRLDRLVPGERSFHVDDGWNAFIDELKYCQVEQSAQENTQVFQYYLDYSRYDFHDTMPQEREPDLDQFLILR